MSLIEAVQFPGPMGEILRPTRMVHVREKWSIVESADETAMRGQAPTFLFQPLPHLAEYEPVMCRGCALTLICAPLAVLMMVLLPYWPWTLLTFVTGWLVALASTAIIWLWKNSTPIDTSEINS